MSSRRRRGAPVAAGRVRLLPPHRREPAVLQVWQEEHRREQAADEPPDVARVAHGTAVRALDERVDDKEDEEEQDRCGAQERPRDGLKVDDEVRDEEAHEAEDGTRRTDERRAVVLEQAAHKVAADACARTQRV
jgi:hypothetical protein